MHVSMYSSRIYACIYVCIPYISACMNVCILYMCASRNVCRMRSMYVCKYECMQNAFYILYVCMYECMYSTFSTQTMNVCIIHSVDKLCILHLVDKILHLIDKLGRWLFFKKKRISAFGVPHVGVADADSRPHILAGLEVLLDLFFLILYFFYPCRTRGTPWPS
jgi:hypothetical protein